MSEPLDHVRRPDLPWRVSTLTECGRDIGKISTWIDRDALLKRVRDWGKQRTSLHTCMTCWQTSMQWLTFAEDPVQAMAREVRGAMWKDTNPTLAAELRALAALADKYRDEFTDFLAGLDETVSLAERRRQRRAAPRQSPPQHGA